jgi:hypothetical protein
MHVILTKVSVPHGFNGLVDYLKNLFGPLPAEQAIAVIAMPKAASFATMEGGRLTVVTAENFDSALREIDSNFREFDQAIVSGQRIYLAYTRAQQSHLAALAAGTKHPTSPDGIALANHLHQAPVPTA